MTIRYGLKFGLILSSVGYANGATMPPNTLAMPPQLLTAPSPVLQQGLNLGLQTPITPSISTVVNEQLNEFEQLSLSPEQIARLKVRYGLTEKLTQSPYLSTPRPVIRSVLMDLAPDSTPPVIRVSAGMLSTLVFSDMNGQAWEIEQVQADGRLFRVHGSQNATDNTPDKADSDKTDNTSYQRSKNMVMIEPLQAWSGSNIVVLLKGKATPIILLVTAGQNEVDLRLDIKVQGNNPDSRTMAYGSKGSSYTVTDIDTHLLAFLDGNIPDLATILKSSDTVATAWQLNNKVYVKTRLDVLHPAYNAKVSTSENVHIYRFDNMATNKIVTLLQRYGQPISISFSELPYYMQ